MSKPTKQSLAKNFAAVLDELNAQQAKAVNTIEGPVLVIAGPGTGKTHVLSARIGRILQETDAYPHNILCLTFTDAGVHAMRERLLQFIGPDAHKVHIFTFHSFCNSIIQENLELFGRHDLEPVSDLERVEIIRGIIDQLPLDHVLVKGRSDIYYYEGHLKDLFSKMKQENWSPKIIRQRIKAYIEDLPQREDYIYKRKSRQFQKGDLKQSKFDKEVDRMQLLQAAAGLLPLYQSVMKTRQRYDFDDMILWVLERFYNRESLLRRYQEQYLYFLVDEYQDTNGAQNSILQLLMNFWEKPNVFVVGDDDQSIYEFQGARLKNILDFHEAQQADLELVLLDNNYRSTQHILDSSKAVIDHNEQRMVANIEGLQKNIQAKHRKYAHSKIRPQLIQYPNRSNEEAELLSKIEGLRDQGIPLSEMAVLYAKHKQARDLIQLLEKKGIPYSTKRRINILDLNLIRNIRHFITYIHKEQKHPNSAEEALYQLLHFDFLGIHTSDLAKISRYSLRLKREDSRPWREMIADEALLQQLQLKEPKSILATSDLLDQLIQDVVNYSPLQWLERFINRSGLLKHLLDSADKAWWLQVLNTFFDFVKNESRRSPRLTLYKLLDLLDSMDANRIALGVQKTIHNEAGIQLMTAHASKGLEFRVVFIMDAVKENWEPSNKGNKQRFTFPDTLTFSSETDALEARRRLFYVAMTRAQEQLFISFSEKNKAGKSLSKAVFVDEILSRTALEVQTPVLDSEHLVLVQALYLAEAKKPILPHQDKPMIDKLLGDFVMSASSFNAYIYCPLSFYFQYVLRVPSTTSPAAAYGTALHNALERLFNEMYFSKTKSYPSQERTLKHFELELQRQKGNFSKKEYNRRAEKGRSFLSKYYSEILPTWIKNGTAEMELRQVEYRGIPMKGTIDKVEIIDKDYVQIVDYKTGSQDAKKIKTPTPAVPEGGKYWRQLIFYKILFENYRNSNQRVISGEIQYLDTDKKGDFARKKILYAPREVEQVQKLLVDTYRKIKAQEFYEGCGKKECKWCNFVRYNIQPNSFSHHEVEEADD